MKRASVSKNINIRLFETEKSVTELRSRRLEGRISGEVLCKLAGFPRNRLSQLERGYIQPRDGDVLLLSVTLDRLIEAKRRVEAYAAKVGWPEIL